MDRIDLQRYRVRAMGACGHLVTADLGRHRLFVATTQHDLDAPGAPADPVSAELDQLDGLILRWCDDGRRRFGERVISLAGVDDDLAAATCADVAGLLQSAESTTGEISYRLAIPASFGPRCRAAVIDGFASAGIRLASSDLVERPVAAAAGWLAHRDEVAGRAPNEPTLVIDNDAGEVSVAALDPATKRLLFVRPLSTGPFDRPGMVMERLRDAIETTARLTHRRGLVRDTDWATVSSSVGDVVVTGCGAKEAMLLSLIGELLPAAHVMPDPVVASERAVVSGLGHLDRFDDWTACWPTLPISIDGTTVVESGQVAGADAFVETDITCGDSGATLSLGTGSTSFVAGTCRAPGIHVPAALATGTSLRTLDDGRVLVLGAEGTVPLSLSPAWPCPGRATGDVAVRSIGRRPVEFTRPAPPEPPVRPQAETERSQSSEAQAQSRLTTSSQS